MPTVEPVPAATMLNPLLEFCKALEGDADRVFNLCLIQGTDNSITEKGAVHAHLDGYTGQCIFYLFDTVQNERLRTIGIMDISGAV